MTSSLKFGTSGLRGLATDLVGAEARRYTTAFLRMLLEENAAIPALYLGHDFRASSVQILADCAAAAAELGIPAISCGPLPTPALAAHAMAANSPSIMVTGSHIPNDRNGLKFYKRDGEISKADEAAILAALQDATAGDYSAGFSDEAVAANRAYVERYANFIAPHGLKGWRIGVFEHSSVGRDLLAEILEGFGADILRLGREDRFVAVDTEAFGDAVFAPLAGWTAEHRLDAIVSTDGDADRPLLMDDSGRLLRGDILGLLSAIYIGAEIVVTPVTSNSAIETLEGIRHVRRTRVGSPFVIAEMQFEIKSANQIVIGFEANGGTLLGSDIGGETPLRNLMTRDAVLPILATIGLAARQGKTISDVVGALPLRPALSGRLEHVPQEKSAKFLSHLSNSDGAAQFFQPRKIVRQASIDGLQFWLDDGAMIHYRASGNAPELRCLVEAPTQEEAEAALSWGLNAAKTAL